MSDIKKYLRWNEVPEKWTVAPYVWKDVAIIIHVEDIIRGGGGGGGGVFLTPSEPIRKIQKNLSKEDFERFVKISCKVNGIDYNQVKKRRKDKLPILTIKEIERTIHEVKMSVRISNISRSDDDI